MSAARVQRVLFFKELPCVGPAWKVSSREGEGEEVRVEGEFTPTV